ncbi:MAG: glycosyltransferase family 2 protein, partial [Thermoanaerobaculia bacterium]
MSVECFHARRGVYRPARPAALVVPSNKSVLELSHFTASATYGWFPVPCIPEVTAVITTHGRPAHVQDAIASLRAETYASVDIVVVDDGCEFVPAAPHRDVPLRIARGHKLGVARARNMGLAAARGEFVIFLDDDDVALPHRIATLVSVARRQDASLCFGMTRRLVDDGVESFANVPTYVAPGAMTFSDLLLCAPHVNAVLARTDVLRA